MGLWGCSGWLAESCMLICMMVYDGVLRIFDFGFYVDLIISFFEN
jgi:hypothetical protein